MAKEKDVPAGAPEIDANVLDSNKKKEIEAAFDVERDKPDVDVSMADAEKADEADDTDNVEPEAPAPAAAGSTGNPATRFFRSFWRHKRWTLPLTLIAILGVLAAIPATRYAAAAQFIEKDVEVTVIDEGTKQPVSSATVKLGSDARMTDSKGKTTLRAKVGDQKLAVSKKYYADASSEVFIPISKPKTTAEIKLKATGRQVPVTVVNKLSGKPLENVTLKAAGTEVKTDKDGKVLLVVPADKPTQAVVLTNGGFNEFKATLTVTEQSVPQNSFAMTPSGKVYFLSKQSGKIDVVKTDLDGANRQTIVAGTGREEEGNTILLASRDWKYLAMLSRRESDKAKLYLIETATDKMTVMDEGNATFGPIGWSDDTFVYSVSRTERKDWQSGKIAFKSYKVSNAKLTTLDENQAEGDQSSYRYTSLQSPSLIGDKLLYNISWFASWSYYSPGQSLEDKNLAIRSVSVNGQNKKDLKTFPASQYGLFDPKLYAPGELYYMYTTSSKPNSYEFLEYEDGVIKPTEGDQETFFNKPYPTYLESPDKKRTFWSEQRDGKETFFVGNAHGEDAKQVAALPEHAVYGWYTDDYLLVSKKGSELFILPVDGSKQTKVTDYHKPNVSFRGYGGGYGGL